MSLAIIVVSHMRDISMLRLQARSIALYVPRSLVEQILVIENDSDGETFAETFITRVLPEYGELKGLVRLIRRDDLAPGISFSHGWRSQQVLKLLSARVVKSEFMLILDAKNHFIRPIDERSYVSPDGRPRTYEISQRGHLQHMFYNSFLVWDLDPERFIDRALPNITPFPARKSSVISMIDTIEAREQISFPAFFLQNDIAEFYLFAAFIAWRDGGFTKEYVFGETDIVTVFVDKANAGAFEWVDMHVRRESTLSFGIHWQAIELLPNDLKYAISAFWIERGLVGDIAEGFSFLI